MIINFHRIVFSVCLILCGTIATAQPSNDDCVNAIRILNPIEFCTGDGQSTNENATPSGFGAPACFNGAGNDVWYSFQAFATAINIVALTSGNGNNLSQAQLALYSGNCNGTINELACTSDNGNSGAISLLENGLTIGETYLIRVSAGSDNTGTFNLCTNNYNPPVEPGQDCRTGAILCDKSPFVVQVLSGGGALPDEGDGTCLEGGFANTITEDQSTWLKWTAGTNGSLTFTITPLKSDDDIDFALFELSDIDACITTTPIRCMATSCPGPTGLDMASTDFEEDFNCESNEDGFVRFLDMEAGKHYGLLINNFSNTSTGFSIEFGGDGEFAGPIADFSIQPDSGLRCDQDFIITDNSSFANGSIIRYNWNFGERAIPQTATGIGPHSVNYESFGEKFIVLTVESDKGCIVTKVLPLFAEPCCDDIDNLTLNLIDANDPLCWYTTDGNIEVEANSPNLEYLYAINNGDFGLNSEFSNLAAGEYQINAVDIKGCSDSIFVTLISPDTIFVNAGRDTTIKLGSTTFLNGSFTPDFGQSICWSPGINTSDSTILNPEVFPFGSTAYTLSIKDENGCITSDIVIINTDNSREIHAPNVFSPYHTPGVNDFFNIFGNLAVQNIESLAIYDRWGNKMYDESNVLIGQLNQGWDGRFNGKEVDPGVYVWYAKVRFIDGVVEEFAGDVTVIR